jgi:hypothetical protein
VIVFATITASLAVGGPAEAAACDPNAPPTVASPTHPDQDRWYPEHLARFTFSACDAPLGYSVEFDSSSATVPDGVPEEVTGTWMAPLTADGDYWLHVRAVRDVGWMTGTAHYRVRADFTAPLPPSLVETSHELGWPSTDRTIDASFDQGFDAHAGVAGYSWAWNEEAAMAADTIIDAATPQSALVSPTLEDGMWWFHVRAIDGAGNAGDDVAFGPMLVDGDMVDVPRIQYSISPDEVEGCVGDPTYYDPVDCAAPLDADTLPEFQGLDVPGDFYGYSGPYYSPSLDHDGVVVLEDTVSAAITGNWTVNGLIRNETPNAVGDVVVQASLYGADAGLLGVVSYEVLVDPLRPHEPAPFSLSSDIPATLVRDVEYTIQTGPPSTLTRQLKMEFLWDAPYGERPRVEHYGYADPDLPPYPHLVVGSVWHEGDVTLPNPRVVAAFLSPEGTVLGSATAQLGVNDVAFHDSLNPGDILDFAIAVDDPVLGAALSRPGTQIALWGIGQ